MDDYGSEWAASCWDWMTSPEGLQAMGLYNVRGLTAVGYDVPITGTLGADLDAAITAGVKPRDRTSPAEFHAMVASQRPVDVMTQRKIADARAFVRQFKADRSVVASAREELRRKVHEGGL